MTNNNGSPDTNKIGHVSGNTGIVTQNQRGNNYLYQNSNEGVLVPDNLPTPQLPPAVAMFNTSIPANALKVFFGSNMSWSETMPHTILKMGNDPMIQIDRLEKANQLIVTVLRIFDDRDNIIARIDKDGFWVENNTRNKRPDPHTLVVFDHLDNEVLRIHFVNTTAIVITGTFRHPGMRNVVTITPTEFRNGGFILSGSPMGENGVDIVID